MKKDETVPTQQGEKKKSRKWAWIGIGVALVAVVVACLVLFSKCGKDRTADTRELLSTIPSDIAYIAVLDIEEIGKTTELPTEGIVPKEGVQPSLAAVYSEGYNTWLTGFLDSTDDFKSAVEKKFNETFKTVGDIQTCGNIAVASNRFWVLLSAHNVINAEDVKVFLGLSDKQSFLSQTEADYIVKGNNDLRGWGDLKATINSLDLDFSKRATYTMTAEALYDDAASLRFNMDFNKNDSKLEMEVLNSKGKTAKFLYPMDKIDTKTIEQSALSGEWFCAVGVSPKFVKRLQEDTKGKGISMLAYIAPTLSALNGTAFAAGAGDNMSGAFTIEGNNTSALAEILNQMDCKVTTQNNQLRFVKGTVQGNVTAAQAAEKLKGGVAGFYGADSELIEKGFTNINALLVPSGNGMILKVEFTTSKPLAEILF